MELIIVTGMSGAGKSKALDLMEDIGYYCVDNMPPQLITKFASMCLQSGEKMKRVAIGADIRNAEAADLSQLIDAINEIKTLIPNTRMLFMDCASDVLVSRFKETRRRHPLADKVKGSVEQMTEIERELLSPLYDMSDYIIDTSSTTIGQLWNLLYGYIVGGDRNIDVRVISFGFKKGLPKDCDFIFDMRALPNPFYIKELKEKTGLDKEVDEYVFSFKESLDYLDKICEMMASLMPLFIKEGRPSLTIGIGCTGGRHRSVCFANRLGKYFEDCGKNTVVIHREIVGGTAK